MNCWLYPDEIYFSLTIEKEGQGSVNPDTETYDYLEVELEQRIKAFIAWGHRVS